MAMKDLLSQPTVGPVDMKTTPTRTGPSTAVKPVVGPPGPDSHQHQPRKVPKIALAAMRGAGSQIASARRGAALNKKKP